MIRFRGLVLAATFLMALSSCAYYNTFYLAKKYYDRATNGLPYLPERTEQGNTQYFTKSIEYSKKLLAQFPEDKLVDDAYLLWSKSLLGVDDPRQTIKLLEDFPVRFPNSSLNPEAKFYLGVAFRQARKHRDAMRVFDEYLAVAHKDHALRPYAQLERSRVLMTLGRAEEAAVAASDVVEHHSKFQLIDKARLARAEALLAQGAHDQARAAFNDLGTRAETDEERLKFLLREADCLEAARRYDEELKLLGDALAHERAPVPIDTAEVRRGVPQPQQGSEAFGRLLTRIATAQMLAGRQEEALASYRRVILDYPRSLIASEAQFRIAYLHETVADDFDKARTEYGKVKEHGAGSPFADQATNRLSHLERLAQFRSPGGDSTTKKAEAGFLLAEQYLFQLDKPERALEEYRRIAQEFDSTAIEAKAMNAQAWVLSRRLKRSAEADSIFWAVVRQHPATEAQIAARDYLEIEGIDVPTDLIKYPEPLLAKAIPIPEPVETEPPPAPTAFDLPPGEEALGDSIPRLGARPGASRTPSTIFSPPGGPPPAAQLDPVRRPLTPVPPPPAAARAPVPRDSTGAPRDSIPQGQLVSPTPVDSTKAPK